MGIELNENLLIQGTDLNEQITWMEKQIERLENEKKEIRDEVHVLLNDTDINEKRASMSSKKCKADIIKQMTEKKIDYEKLIAKIKRQINEVFSVEEMEY